MKRLLLAITMLWTACGTSNSTELNRRECLARIKSAQASRAETEDLKMKQRFLISRGVKFQVIPEDTLDELIQADFRREQALVAILDSLNGER